MRMIRTAFGVAALAGLASAVLAAEMPPIRQHPQNSHYFQWQGRSLALITSAEHYGAVLNADFDFRRYLDTLQREGMNYTRIFSGSYVEMPGVFGIARNSQAPAPGRFLAPWARSTEPGYAGGGNKFDLSRWNPDYLTRLKEFLDEAGRRGIVVELTFFCSTYTDGLWGFNPFNPTNNINGTQLTNWHLLNTLSNANIFPFQEQLARHLVRELNGVDNVFFEIQNEPWVENNELGDFINPYMRRQREYPNVVEITSATSVAWQTAIARAIIDEESRLPQRHLLAQNIANFRLPVRSSDLAPGVNILNFHYAYAEAATWNYGLGKVIGYDESGFAGPEDAIYRREAWNFIMSGGGLFNSLDYSFSVGHEDGTDSQPNSPGGGSAGLRRQLSVLSRFLHSFDLASLHPDTTLVLNSPGVVTRSLSCPGKAYALYVRGRGPTELTLNLPKAAWHAEWLDTTTGRIVKENDFASGPGPCSLLSPDFVDDIALRIVRGPARSAKKHE